VALDPATLPFGMTAPIPSDQETVRSTVMELALSDQETVRFLMTVRRLSNRATPPSLAMDVLAYGPAIRCFAIEHGKIAGCQEAAIQGERR
jgi:hypothetical protein